MSKWIGYAVSVNCGEPLGCYQGTILEADGTTVTLTKAFRNGFPYPKSQVTLNAADIKELKIIESKPEPAEQPHSTVAVTKTNKKAHRATVCENLQANNNSGSPAAPPSGAKTGTGRAGAPPRSKPIDIQPPAPRHNKTNTHAGSFGNANSTPKSRSGGSGGGGVGGGAGGGLDKTRRRNEACFGSSASPALHDDFDFEGNLALFDKRAFWEQMRVSSAARPDLLPGRAADDKFRHDENILGSGGGGVCEPMWAVPSELRGPTAYVTDAGGAVPSVTPRVRAQLWDSLRRLGLQDFSLALLARAAADVALRLVGGVRRLEPRNAHQAPRVVCVAGAHALGAAGLAAARVLASHGARAAAHLPASAPAPACPALARELAAAALGEVALVSELHALPSPDLVLLALYDPRLDDDQDKYTEALSWATSCRAALVTLEPPPCGWDGVCARASVVALAPPALPPSLGRVYLADVAPPLRVFSEVRITYRPPFGASPLLALHPADDCV